jgi:hypothetical protein
MTPSLKTFRVRMAETTAYYIDVRAKDEETAVEIAEDKHDRTGLAEFQVDDDADGGTSGWEAEQLTHKGARR